MKKELCAVAGLLFSLVTSPHVDAAPRYTLHGGGVGWHLDNVASIQIVSRAIVHMRFATIKTLPKQSLGMTTLVVQNTPTGRIRDMNEAADTIADHTSSGDMALLTPTECTTSCLLTVESKDTYWTITISPPSAVSAFKSLL